MAVGYSSSFLSELSERARRSPRRRQHHNIHTSYADRVQRLLNAIEPDSYIRPHRHTLDPKLESLVAIKGRFALLIFDEAGEIEDCTIFGTAATDAALVEVLFRQWHSVVALESGSILLEVKEGPFDPAQAKEAAPWSPEEDSRSAKEYHAGLHAAVARWIAREDSDNGGTLPRAFSR